MRFCFMSETTALGSVGRSMRFRQGVFGRHGVLFKIRPLFSRFRSPSYGQIKIPK